MTDRIKEQLSAFLDGELPDPESALLLKRLERDDESVCRFVVPRARPDVEDRHGVAQRGTDLGLDSRVGATGAGVLLPDAVITGDGHAVIMAGIPGGVTAHS